MSRYTGGIIRKEGLVPTTSSASGVWTLSDQARFVKAGLWPINGLYVFTNATFTPGGQTGKDGPSLTQARTGLTGTGVDAWKNNTEYFNTSGGIQLWTVPATGTYRFDIVGASGGYDLSRAKSCSRIGLGGRYQFDIVLTQGTQIKIVVGQRGDDVPTSSYLGGGGAGGTFVFTGSRGGSGLIAVAGGGGGAGSSGAYTASFGGGPVGGIAGNFAGTSGSAGLCDNSYDGRPGLGGTNGAGGQNGSSGWSNENTGGGAGWISDGQFNPNSVGEVPAVRGTGFTGGSLSSSGLGAVGGFGGGGATSYTGSSFAGGGGGGGYSGGGGAGWNANSGGCVSNSSASGGGGGGFVVGTAINPVSTSGFNEGHGYASITKL